MASTIRFAKCIETGHNNVLRRQHKKDTPKLLFSNVRSLCHQSDLPCSLENSISQARTARLYTYSESQSILVSSIDTHQVQLLKYSTAHNTAQSIFILMTILVYLGKRQTGKSFLFGRPLFTSDINRQTKKMCSTSTI